MLIQSALETDINDVLFVERTAFGSDEEANLVKDLINDDSAKPVVSLLAYIDGQAVGHILFTKVRINSSDVSTSAAILAPLAVIPSAQSQGIGSKLVKEGFRLLSKSGVDLIFVLGHPEYYPRFGFKPAGKLGFEAPYPIPCKNANAWMVHELRPGVIGCVSGKIICAETLNHPEYWRE